MKQRTVFGQGVQSKAAKIDMLLINSDRALTIDEIASAIKHNRSAVASHVNTLRRMQFVASETVETSRCKVYRLTDSARTLVASKQASEASEASEQSSEAVSSEASNQASKQAIKQASK